ncbi:MAG: endolytic transglycosylase MltG [Candidatus Andersenbacteria bacterium]
MISITNPYRFAGTVIVVIGALLLIVWGLATLIWGNSTIQKTEAFTIESGATAQRVWEKLEEEEFVNQTLPLKYAGWKQDAASKIKAGTYYLEEGEPITEVVGRFITGDTQPDELTITYPEGFTLKQIAARTASRGISTEEAFLAAASDPAAYAEEFPFLGNMPPNRTLEGYLFPDTYKVFPDDTPEDVIKRMLATFDQRVRQAELPDKARAADRTLDEIIIMASIIEREVISDDDMALVSGVLWKRNDEEMGLGADATIRYILDQWDSPLTVQNLAVDSPYNTRRFRGLPPGPIGNPGLRALMAAVEPQESEYYYYLSAPSGETIFSRTNDEHNVNKAKHLQ